MLNYFDNLLRRKPKYRRIDVEKSPELLITEDCLQSIDECIEPERNKRNEGIAYLYGRTDGKTTLAIGALRPKADTSSGSFFVSTTEMSSLVRKIRNCGLQLICQVHTHPRKAYHSDGDIEGLKLICEGYVSIVLPNYGDQLPKLNGAVFFIYNKENGFKEIPLKAIKIIPNKL